jgi:phospholipid/cholesterol/gamma-HCH transport system permease protein
VTVTDEERGESPAALQPPSLAAELGLAVSEAVAPLRTPFQTVGMILDVSWRAIVNVPAALKYRAQIVSLISDVAVGAGALVVGAGAVIVVIFMTGVIGVQVSLEGVKGLELIGAEDLIGFLSAFANVREITPLAAAIIFAAQIGANFTAELGAMRISEEIDALEVMSVPALRFLVSTRLIASFVTVLPLYIIGLWIQLLTTKLTSVYFFGIAPGVYDQYFNLYLPRIDIVYSVVKILVFIVIITFVHCAYGFRVSGGPEAVGQAVGRAVRLSITTIFVVNFVLSYLFWGTADTVRFSG